MGGETDLGAILANLTVSRHEEPVTVVTTTDPVTIGDGIVAVIEEGEGTTVVGTVSAAERHGWPVELVAAWLTVDVHTSLEAVGLTAAMSAALTERGIPANVVAGYHHDHLIVPLERAAEAVEALEGLAGAPFDPWDEHAAGWDEDPAARAYASAAFESLVDVLRERGGRLADARVCDFGCGTGLLTERLVDAVESIDAVDTSPAMLARLAAKAGERGWSTVRPSSVLPSTVGHHDLVVCSSVLAFVDDLPATLRRLVRLLAPGGVLVHWDWERDGDDPTSHGLRRDEVRRALTDAGLDAVEVDTGFTTTVDGVTMQPLMGVGRRP